MEEVKNKVILIGGNHHNGLGLVRCFGINNIFPFGIIVGEDAEKSFVRKSKYWSQTWCVSKDEDVVGCLLDHFSNESKKPVVIPYSDTAAEIVDLNYNKLENFFLLPSISKKKGKIVELMDKQEQYRFAKQYNILMAKSCVVNLDDIVIDDDMKYPCIVKPVVSAEGEKSDISKCNTKKETIQYLNELRKKGYHRILVQEYIDVDTEFVMIGSIHNGNCSWTNFKKIRMWPLVGGSSSYLQVSNDIQVDKFFESIREAFVDINYDGCFDVDALYSNGKIFLNEVNWRNSGIIYSVIGTTVFYPVIWYFLKTNMNIPNELKFTTNNDKIYSMDESLDLRHVVSHNISLSEWLKERKKCKSFALWQRSDLKPTIAQYLYLAKELLIRHGV